MPLNDHEKRQFFDILGFSVDEDVISMARTILKDQVPIQNKSEAVSAILAYSLDAKELFRRKKLKKDSLFQYLYDRKVDGINPSAEKSVLVQRILTFWGSDLSYEAMDDEETSISICSPSSSSQPQQGITSSDPLNCWLDDSLVPNEMEREFAVEFCRWFYFMLGASSNSNNSSNASQQDGSQFDGSHFFGECQMCFFVKHTDRFTAEKYEGAADVSSKLLHLSRDEKIIFNPNLDRRGVQTFCDAFGRKVIVVAGTLHRGNAIGLFEQNFGLIRDPATQRSWKIAFTRLVFSVTDAHGSEPTLEYTKRMLTGF